MGFRRVFNFHLNAVKTCFYIKQQLQRYQKITQGRVVFCEFCDICPNSWFVLKYNTCKWLVLSHLRFRYVIFFIIADHLTKNTLGKSNLHKPTIKSWKKINRTKTFERIHHAVAERKLL